MNEDIFHKYLEHFDGSFRQMISEMADFQISRCDETSLDPERKIAVIVGITLSNRGRILFEAEQGLVNRITEGMNGEPLEDPMQTYYFLTEFANIFCGKAVSRINNLYKTELRLTPPALFAGSGMRIITPGIRSEAVFYTSESGRGLLNVGIEGV